MTAALLITTVLSLALAAGAWWRASVALAEVAALRGHVAPLMRDAGLEYAWLPVKGDA